MSETFAVVTGGSKGIGLALCQTFARAGFHVATCSRSQQDLDDLQQKFGDYQGEIITRKTDMSIRDEVEAFASFINGHWGQVDILVNNAGVFIPGKVTEEEEGVFDTMMKTNLNSAYHLTRALLPLIRKSTKGHIFNMCSIASIMAYPNGGTYTISKYALLGLTKALRAELLEDNIKVTAVLPGATWSNSWKGADFPEDRLMQSQDIADAIMAATQLGPSAVVEEILIRPQLGDL